MPLDIIAFGPHPDDVELFCGGTIHKLSTNGNNVGIVDLTQGELSTRGDLTTRKHESELAANVLNISERINLHIPDGSIENTAENRLKVVNALRQYRPELVLIPYWEDRHPDHVNGSKLITDAVFYSGLAKIETESEPFRPGHICHYFCHKVKEPTIIVDVSDDFDMKLESIKAYKSQFYDASSENEETYISSKSFWQFIEIRARYFGHQIGVRYGEPFFLNKSLKSDNLVSLFS